MPYLNEKFGCLSPDESLGASILGKSLGASFCWKCLGGLISDAMLRCLDFGQKTSYTSEYPHPISRLARHEMMSVEMRWDGMG